MGRKTHPTRRVHRPKAIYAGRSPMPVLALVILTLILFFVTRFYSIPRGAFVLFAVTPALTAAAPEIPSKPKYFDVQVRDTSPIQTERAPSREYRDTGAVGARWSRAPFQDSRCMFQRCISPINPKLIYVETARALIDGVTTLELDNGITKVSAGFSPCILGLITNDF